MLAVSIVFSTSTINISVSAEQNVGTDRVELQWARSSESADDSFIVPIRTNGGDAWSYLQACNSTPLRYFENSKVQNDFNTRAEIGREYVSDESAQLVGKDYIWDCGKFFDKSIIQNRGSVDSVDFDWAS